MTTKDGARESSLLSAKAEEKGIHSLYYAGENIYVVMCRIESVVHELLSEENVALYGSCIV